MIEELLAASDSAVDAVVFDWGGVLTDLPSIVIPKVMEELGISPVDPKKRTSESVAGFHQLERGQMSLPEYLNLAKRSNPGAERLWNPDDEFFVFRRLGQRSAVIGAVAQLRAAGYRTALLSNNVAEYWDGVIATLDVDELFDVTINSAHVGFRKPEREIYELALSELGVRADRAVFLDDSRDNTKGAVEVGMRAVHVTASDDDLFADLGTVLRG